MSKKLTKKTLYILSVFFFVASILAFALIEPLLGPAALVAPVVVAPLLVASLIFLIFAFFQPKATNSEPLTTTERPSSSSLVVTVVKIVLIAVALLLPYLFWFNF